MFPISIQREYFDADRESSRGNSFLWVSQTDKFKLEPQLFSDFSPSFLFVDGLCNFFNSKGLTIDTGDFSFFLKQNTLMN